MIKIVFIFLMVLLSAAMVPNRVHAYLSGDNSIASFTSFHDSFDGKLINGRKIDREWMKSFSHRQSWDNGHERWWHERGRDGSWEDRHCPKPPDRCPATPIPSSAILLMSGLFGLAFVLNRRLA